MTDRRVSDIPRHLMALDKLRERQATPLTPEAEKRIAIVIAVYERLYVGRI